MDAHITKPVDAARLLGLIDSLVPPEQRIVPVEQIATGLPVPISTHPNFQPAAIDPAVIEDLLDLGQGSSFFADLVADFFLDAEALLADMEGDLKTARKTRKTGAAKPAAARTTATKSRRTAKSRAAKSSTTKKTAAKKKRTTAKRGTKRAAKK